MFGAVFQGTKFRQVSESGQIERTVVSVAVELLEVLPSFCHLSHLDLSRNEFGAEGARLLADTVKDGISDPGVFPG